ncbi:hypothetical protein ACLESD_47955 [Pyxidicoccus sp. 3LFB2]
MDLSSETLLAIARKYWRADRAYDGQQVNSPEYDRLCDLWEERLRDDLGRWTAFLEALRPELPGFELGNATVPSASSSFRCVAYARSPRMPPPFHFAVVGCVSILAPIYTVYGVQYDFVGTARHNPRVSFEPLSPDMSGPADIIARKIESMFDVRRLPREVAATPVPLFTPWKEPPRTTLFHAFFDSQPDNLP